MPARLCIQICSTTKPEEREIEIFKAEHWTTDAESILMQRVHELLTVIRPIGKSLHLNLNVEVTDAITAVRIINQKLKNADKRNHKLSGREIEVLGLIMQGYTNKEIALKLYVSFETVKSHRKNILEKTGAKNTAVLISYYHQTFFDK